MSSIVLRKQGGVLVPVDEPDQETVAKLKEGEFVRCTIQAKRNIRQHRLFWALVGLLVDNTEVFPSKEAAADSIKIGVGHVETGVDAWSGRAYLKPKSIAFEALDGTEFTRFFDRCLYLLCNRWLAGLDVEDLRNQVLEMVDGPERSSLGKRIK